MNKLFFLWIASLCGLLLAACGDDSEGDEHISDAALADAADDAAAPCDMSFELPIDVWGDDGGGLTVGGDDQPCTWDLQAPTPEEDRSELRLYFHVPPATGGTPAQRVSDAAACEEEAGSQFYVAGDELHLCPTMCRVVEMASHGYLTVHTACAD